MSFANKEQDQKMYFSAFYAEELPSTYIREGIYGKDNCGGPITWIITSDKQANADVFSIPYNGQKYAYIFTLYYENNQDTLLWKYLKDKPIVKTNDVPQYVLFTDSIITNDMFDMDFDDIGGSVDVADLSDKV
jgi:hypothetical protein